MCSYGNNAINADAANRNRINPRIAISDQFANDGKRECDRRCTKNRFRESSAVDSEQRLRKQKCALASSACERGNGKQYRRVIAYKITSPSLSRHYCSDVFVSPLNRGRQASLAPARTKSLDILQG